MDKFYDFFKKDDQPKALAVMKMEPPREIYIREKDPGLDLMHQQETKVSNCDREIEQKRLKSDALLTQIKELKKKQAAAPKDSTQAKQAEAKGITLLAQKKRLDTDIVNIGKKRDGMQHEIDTFKKVKDAQETTRLRKAFAAQMQIEMEGLDPADLKEITTETRFILATANKMTAGNMLNPYTNEEEEAEEKDALADEFANIMLSEEGEESEEIESIEEKKPMRVKPSPLVDSRSKQQQVIDDDYF